MHPTNPTSTFVGIDLLTEQLFLQMATTLARDFLNTPGTILKYAM